MEYLARHRRAADGDTWLNRSRAPLARASAWRSFRTGTWLGWQIESNWADPCLFAIYVVIEAARAGRHPGGDVRARSTRGAFASPVFTYMYLGNAFYIYVGAVMSGMGWAVVQDREHYRTLKNIYSAPVAVPFYLVGRGHRPVPHRLVSVVVILALVSSSLGSASERARHRLAAVWRGMRLGRDGAGVNGARRGRPDAADRHRVVGAGRAAGQRAAGVQRRGFPDRRAAGAAADWAGAASDLLARADQARP